MKPHDELPDWAEGDQCPVHESSHKKTYTFGSSMSAETSVCVFHGCRCAVAVSHDPVGTYPSVARWFPSYGDASGVGVLRAMDAAVRYR
jgi:hypothetical protein